MNSGPGVSPYDTVLSGGSRFGVEVIAWVAGPWAAAQINVWLAIPVAIVLIAIPAIFSTPGDKKQVVVATSGPKRVRIEFSLQAVALAGAWVAWPAWLAVPCTVVVAVALFSGVPRTRWLLAGAPLD